MLIRGPLSGSPYQGLFQFREVAAVGGRGLLGTVGAFWTEFDLVVFVVSWVPISAAPGIYFRGALQLLAAGNANTTFCRRTF